jgi:hypothetical protein
MHNSLSVFFSSTPSAFQRIKEDNEPGVRVKHVTRTRNDHTRSGLFAIPCLQACNCSSVVYMVLELAKISYLRNAIPTTPPSRPYQLLRREVTLMVSPALARHSLFRLLYILQPSTLAQHSLTERSPGGAALDHNTYHLYVQQGKCHCNAARGPRWRAVELEARCFFLDSGGFKAVFRTCARQAAGA